MRTFTGGTCDDQARRIPKEGAQTWEREPPKQRTVGSLAWLPGARWKVSQVSGDRFVQIECAQTKTGGYIFTLDVPHQTRPDREVLDIAARALAATSKP